MPTRGMTRRQMLNLALASPLLAAVPNVGLAQPRRESRGLDLRLLMNAPSAVVPVDDSLGDKQVTLVREWKGPLCRSRLINKGRQSVRLKEVVLFDLAQPLPPAPGLYAEGFQMLSQTSGTFETTARQNLSRNWQNGRLWWNDPDAVVLTGELSEDEFRFHAAAIYASGGIILSGDDLTKITPERLAMLKRLLPPTGVAASFEDNSMRVGVVKLPDSRVVCLFNWDEKPQTMSFSLPEPATDYWSGESLGRNEGTFTVKDMPANSARLLVCKR